MTTDTDKLVETALNDAYEKGWCAAAQWANRDDLRHDTGSIAYEGQRDAILAGCASGLRSAILADAAKDVEPVAFMFQHSETGRITFVDAWQKENGWAAGNPRFFEVDALVPASTLAAAQALNAELVARLEGLEKDAARYRWLRDGELTADYPYPVMRMGGSRVDDQTIWADELDAAIDDAISAAQHPQQEQSK